MAHINGDLFAIKQTSNSNKKNFRTKFEENLQKYMNFYEDNNLYIIHEM